MKRICVYSGSNPGSKASYVEAAINLGKAMVANGSELVYGGGSLGLMGRVANAVMEHDGKAIGVMPRGLFRGELVHQNLTELHEVETMHERKALMADLADGFIALPGGVGTFEELFEAICWAQIGLHQKPIGLLNVEGFFDPLMKMMEHSAKEGFMRASSLELYIVEEDPQVLLERMNSYTAPVQQLKWTELEK
ncbi:TIGR00730 family Rossman fold protein [Tumebacillus lipolyticus]|uniref:Cytokinin riboside 5'-monophosphate phosphoribohydrolase n=1 Tax=Tumebacillus lipolyticus TaxID=1280370 RepID=A0ABW4ZSE8_9BACL